MDDLKLLLNEARNGLSALQKSQIQYDSEMWDISDPSFSKVRHVHIHLSISIGKIAKLLEGQDHLVHHGGTAKSFAVSDVGPIVADLLMHAAQIATAYDVDLGSALVDRYAENARRFAPDGVFGRVATE